MVSLRAVRALFFNKPCHIEYFDIVLPKLWCVIMLCLRIICCENVKSQWLHLYDFSPECFEIHLKLLFCEKALSLDTLAALIWFLTRMCFEMPCKITIPYKTLVT